MLESEITGASTRAAWAWLGALSAVTGHRGVPCETKDGWAGWDCSEFEMANGKTKGRENVLSVGREEAQELEDGHDESPPWVWRRPAARRGERTATKGGREGEGAIPLEQHVDEDFVLRERKEA